MEPLQRKKVTTKEKLVLPTLPSGKKPLIIVDGKEVANTIELSPDDIKTIDVFKDEAAIEKYGEKAKNGVVVITTNKNDVTVVGFAKSKKADIPAPPSAPNEFAEEEVFMVVEQMPMFPNSATKDESFKNLLEFIYKNLKYPTEAKEAGIEGTVVVKFIVTKTGDIKEPTIIRSIGGGAEEEVLRVVDLMNELPDKWTPGKQRGRAVNVQFNLPVKFKLTDDAPATIEKKEEAEQSKDSNFEFVEVYPNPTDGQISIHFKSKINKPTTVTITNSNGAQIFQQEITGKEGKLNDIQLKNAETGLLNVTLRQGEEIVTKKIVVQK